MAEVDSKYIRKGLWTNVKDGPIMGQTITTDSRTSTLLIVILTIFSSLGTAHLWHLLTFLIHQARANGAPSDGLFRQQQAILRTLPTPSTLMAESIKLWWSWRHRTDRVTWRSLLQLFLGILFSVTTIAAGILSSYVTSSLDIEVLVDSPSCGPIDIEVPLSNISYTTYYTSVDVLAQPYSKECYRDNPSSTDCRAFIHPKIPFEYERAKCSFGAQMCSDEQLPALKMDSGLLDLNDAFGLNLAKTDRIQFRRVTTCSLLPNEGYTTTVNASDFDLYSRPTLPGEQIMLGLYGTGITFAKAPVKNATFALSLMNSNFTTKYQFLSGFWRAHPEWANVNAVDILPALRVADADTTLLTVIKNRVSYLKPVNDPMFAAHTVFNGVSDYSTDKQTSYFSDFPISTVGCSIQYQYCTANKQCTALSYLPRRASRDTFPQATDVQLAVLQLLITTGFIFDLSNAATFALASSLLPNGNNPMVQELPDDQWIKELVGWESWVWTAFQIALADYAIGGNVRDTLANGYMLKPRNDGEKKLCQMQRVRKSGELANINFFGLVFIITFSAVITIIDILLLKFLIYLSKFRQALSPRLDRWIQDDVLQLQRRAYEAHGLGGWTDLNKDIPLTTEKQLPDLPLESLPPQPDTKATASPDIVSIDSQCGTLAKVSSTNTSPGSAQGVSLEKVLNTSPTNNSTSPPINEDPREYTNMKRLSRENTAVNE